MGIIYRTHREPDLHNYERELNGDGTEKHICCDAARYHVLSYSYRRDILGNDTMETHCLEPNCEINRRADAGSGEAK
jgi:hypothetical protein